MAEPFITEFLYRAYPAENEKPSAWHVTLLGEGDDGFGGKVYTERTMTMQQAIDAGYTLPKVIETINAAVLAELEPLRADVQQKARDIDDAVSARDAAIAERNAVRLDLVDVQRRVVELSAEKAE